MAATARNVLLASVTILAVGLVLLYSRMDVSGWKSLLEICSDVKVSGAESQSKSHPQEANTVTVSPRRPTTPDSDGDDVTTQSDDVTTPSDVVTTLHEDVITDNDKAITDNDDVNSDNNDVKSDNNDVNSDNDDVITATPLPKELIGARDDDPALISFIRRHLLVSPYPGPRKLAHPEKSHYSQVHQSQIVDVALGRRRTGFFVECGAAEGEMFSNSMFFEKSRNWTGLLVEANPVLFDSVRRKRRVNLVNACLSPTTTASVQNFTFAKLMGGLSGHIAGSHLRNIEKARKISGHEAVACVPLHSLLLALNVNHVDYFSLDVEGPELEILQTIPFDKITIDIFTIEFGVIGCGSCSKAKLQRIDNFFLELGGYDKYRTIGQQDVIYRRAGLR